MNRTVLIVFLAVVGLGAGVALLFLGPERGGWLWVGFSLVALMVLAGLNARNTNYKCPSCGYMFQVGFLTELFSAHNPTRGKRLRCPRCDRLGWATASRKHTEGQTGRKSR